MTTEVVEVDILIVGSGPTGSSIALHLVQSNPEWAKRILIIDKAVHPRDKLCGGGITYLGENILTDLGLPFEPNNFAVREVQLRYQDKSYSFRGDPVFRIVRRREFDHWLVQQVETRAVAVSQGEGVTGVEVLSNYVAVTTDKRTIHAQIVIAADGSRSFIRSRLKWNDDSRVARLIEVDTPEDPQQNWNFRDKVAVFDFTHMTDNNLQGYYWDFPSYVDGAPIMNRGVFDSRSRPEKPKANLKTVLHDSMAVRERDSADFKLKGAPIRWFDAKGQFSQPRVLLAGDAAGVDPLFGEGISFALAYGPPVAETVIDAFARADFSLESYRKRLLSYSMFKQLRLRVAIARFAYKINSPRIFRMGWTAARWVVARTPWRNPNYVPAKQLARAASPQNGQPPFQT
jgi:flavin-dependent dehydrogenase